MNGEGDGEPDDRRSQRFRNVVAALIVGTILGTLVLLYIVALGGASETGIVGAICAGGFLVITFLGWEYLMKPEYGLHAWVHDRRTSVEEPTPSEEERLP